jgi:hypothetical protein
MKRFSALIIFLLQTVIYSQNNIHNEKPPVFVNCENLEFNEQQTCFESEVRQSIYNNLKIPQRIIDVNYKGEVSVIFEVNAEGQFKVIYTDAMYDELKEEMKRVFKLFPNIKPGTYNGKPTFKQYSITVNIPLNQNISTNTAIKSNGISQLQEKAQKEFDSVNMDLTVFTHKTYSSQLNIPFTHSDYARFDSHMNRIGTNSHTASKPFIYEDVSRYYDVAKEKESLRKETNSWVGEKLWNEHLVAIEGKDYWFTIDPILDLQAGKDTEANFNSTYNNTRGLLVQGGLGKKFNFYTSVFESQGRFAHYVNRYAESLKAFGPDPAIIPGRGIGKSFKTQGYDYPVAEAYLSYSPLKILNVQFGHGKNFIGDGYRSILLSDVASPHPFLKINTSFWKIKYTNSWMWLKDVRPESTQDKAFLTKYMATHYLSWNVSKRFNLGLFESVLWTNSNGRGFDVNYLNPIIFYRAIEFATGQGAGNAVLGASAKYKWNNNINIYSQFILDEFSLNDVKGGERSWKNKYGYQLGLKYYNAFKVDNLLLQFEYNRIRPYVYSHNTVLNYGHNNQSMAHLWGANFSETIVIGRYHYKRWFADAKVIFGVRGLDFNNDANNFSYGGDIYRNYNERPFDTGVEVGQGLRTNTFNGNVQAGFIINTASNLKLFADITFRNFNPESQTASTFKSNTVWFNLGLRTDLFNWYFDF